MDEKEPRVGDIVFSSESAGLVAEAIVQKCDDYGYFASVVVREGTEQKWQSEEAMDMEASFAFGSWFDGSGLPVFWGDIDQDGKPELLAPVPKADLSPTVYRIFRWTGEELLFLKKRCLVETEEKSFAWTAPELTPDECTWVDHFYQSGKADVVKLTSSDTSQATISLEACKGGFQILSETTDT